jgi:hypothetical protein
MYSKNEPFRNSLHLSPIKFMYSYFKLWHSLRRWILREVTSRELCVLSTLQCDISSTLLMSVMLSVYYIRRPLSCARKLNRICLHLYRWTSGMYNIFYFTDDCVIFSPKGFSEIYSRRIMKHIIYYSKHVCLFLECYPTEERRLLRCGAT